MMPLWLLQLLPQRALASRPTSRRANRARWLLRALLLLLGNAVVAVPAAAADAATW